MDSAHVGHGAEQPRMSHRIAERQVGGREMLEKRLRVCYVYPNWIYEKSSMTSSTVFTSNRSQAVRLPKAVAFPESVHQVDILRIGSSRVIVPRGRRWDDFFQHTARASEDFMIDREQPPAEPREPL
jgi:antitoxin VapB